ncbi:MAG: 1-acyl-sn-glycerol-3-phosphate acyltransferase [Clostridia bacterium]|nr:1-acyl-sn-glycerol-3-phosphate acyltransferase [Clostridia bacterium]
MEKSESRLKIIKKIEELEKQQKWDCDVEDDPVTTPLLPNKIDYLNKKLSSKIATFFANKTGTAFYENLIKKRQFIIKEVIGIENFLAIKDKGAIITCNHFNVCDNYAVWRSIKPHVGKKERLYKVIREGNYTNSPPPFGFILRHCNTLPLSSNADTMKKFMRAINVLLKSGKKILVYPEQAMWWNYKKPRPFKSGAFRFAATNMVPVLPFFITMKDSDVLDSDGFYVQEYYVHILPAIYPDLNKTRNVNMEEMKDKNYQAWKEVYENFYNQKLTYLK